MASSVPSLLHHNKHLTELVKGIIIFTLASKQEDETFVAPLDIEKLAALRAVHAVNPHPQDVTDPAFRSGNPFFDPRDLMQVKYEMLRRVHLDGHSVTHAAASFGFSRVAFYDAQHAYRQDGLPGLLPQRPGPRRAHKLSADVVAALEQVLIREPALRAPQLARIVQQRFGLVVHPRSIERALERQKKLPDESGAINGGEI